MTKAGIVEVITQYTKDDLFDMLGPDAAGEDPSTAESIRKLEVRRSELERSMSINFDVTKTEGENLQLVEQRINQLRGHLDAEASADLENYFNEKKGEINSVSVVIDNPNFGYVEKAEYYFNHLKDPANPPAAFPNVKAIEDTLHEAFLTIKDAKISEAHNVIETMLKTTATDPLVTLEVRFKETDRPIYAIAWFILMLQTFSLVFMYYKRIIVLLLLIVLFPIVMAVYVVDKAGDGKSQSLKTWFQEFIANTTIQFVHALVYISIVNI
jgi:hypothetical protein